MNVSLTPELESFVQTQVQTGIFGTADEVIRAALQRMQAEEMSLDYDPELEQMLIEGLDSGEPKPMTKEDWDAIRKQALVRLEKE